MHGCIELKLTGTCGILSVEPVNFLTKHQNLSIIKYEKRFWAGGKAFF